MPLNLVINIVTAVIIIPISRIIRPSPEGRIVVGDSLVPQVLKRFKDTVHEVRL